MSIAEMHYDFKKKLNKIDSQQYRNLRIPEIDWTLNEAFELFVKMVAKPRIASQLGFEIGQRSIEDIKNVVSDSTSLTIQNDTAILPEDYWFYVSGEVFISRGDCVNQRADLNIQQHDDRFEYNIFYESSFEWREVNAVFNKNGIKLYSDETFNIDSVYVTFIETLPFIHYAEGYSGGTYRRPNGDVLTGTQDCPLIKGTHKEIVDIAVLIATGEIQTPDYQIKLNKLNLNNLK